MKLLLLSLFSLIFSVSVVAQDFPFGQFAMGDMDMKKYDRDTAAHALVLKEYGKSWVSVGDRITLEHDYHVKIKIFDAKAFSLGDVEIPLYKSDNDRFEEVRDIEAITYYKDDNGAVQQTKLNEKQIFHVNHDKHHDLVKFAMPNLLNGCIIEYHYHLQSPYLWNFRNWEFQTEIPKIYSEYEVHLPAVYNYNVSLRGPLKLTKNTAEIEKDCFSAGGVKCDCSKINYIMANIPAFVEESQMTSPKNFISAIYFELSDYTSLETGTNIKMTKEWKDIDYDLKHDDNVGSQMKRKDLLKDRMQNIIAGKTDALQKAKDVYQYIKNNMKWNGHLTFFSEDGIKKALDAHSGSSGDINLALVAALSAAGINTEAVLLSTRDNGVVNKLYPVESDFNYVVAKANIGDKSYLLDATDPLLPFGLLPLRCINDQGRVISLDKPSYWMDLVASQKESSTNAFDMTLLDDGKVKGTITIFSLGYKAYEKRRAIKKFNSVDEYFEDLRTKKPNTKILKAEIGNLDSLDMPLVEKYEISFDAYNKLNDRVAFSPFFFNKMNENPFKLTERSYPVDWGAPFDEKFILNMHLPSGYKVDAPLQSGGVTMPNQGGRFFTNYTPTDDGFTFSYITQLNHSIYSPQEYPYLKELFNKIIQAERTEIEFKKK